MPEILIDFYEDNNQTTKVIKNVWIDATQNPDDMLSEINSIMADSPEISSWQIGDSDGFYGTGEDFVDDLSDAHELAVFIEEHGELGARAYQHYGSVDAAKDAIENSYEGEYRSFKKFAEEYIDGTGEVPEHLQAYFDYGSLADDMEADYNVLDADNGSVYIFRA